MFIIKTYIDKSNIHGNGVFAGENIKKGQVVWKFNKVLDKKISVKTFNSLEENIKYFVEKNGYLDSKNKFYFISGDNDIYSNHSENPNLIESDNINNNLTKDLIAVRDINIGEELTQNYLDYIAEENFKFKMGI